MIRFAPAGRSFAKPLTPARRRAALQRGTFVAGLLTVAALLAGCESSTPVTSPTMQPIAASTPSTDHFTTGITLIEKLDEFEAEQAMAQAAYHLNRWIAAQPPDAGWLREPMIERSLGKLAQASSLRKLDRLHMTAADMRYLQQTTWLRDIARWCLAAPIAPDMAELLAELPADLPVSAREELTAATRLFDWTVRNIQLDPPPTITSEVTQQLPAGTLPAERGLPGPGYSMKPWQTLLFGHGDTWLRARVFMLLARQRGVPTVVLSVAKDAQSEARPWVVAVPAAGELYLFDPELGLPLPREDGRGIATLSHLLDHPPALEQLNVGQTLKYPFPAEDLAHIVARIDASGEALSHRMKVIEGRLTGEQRMILTVDSRALAALVRPLRGIADIKLWDVPFAAEVYEIVWEGIHRNDSRAVAVHDRDMLLFGGFSPLLQGRQHFFRHEFARTDDDEGALAKFMEARNISDADIESLPNSTEAQKRIGLERGRAETNESWQAKLYMMQMLVRQGKHHASYWIGLVHYENGNYEDARNWFERRTIQSTPDSFWVHGARYNLARSYEALGQFADARSTYLLDESPQRLGNLLRARRLRLTKLASEETDGQPSTEDVEAKDVEAKGGETKDVETGDIEAEDVEAKEDKAKENGSKAEVPDGSASS